MPVFCANLVNSRCPIDQLAQSLVVPSPFRHTSAPTVPDMASGPYAKPPDVRRRIGAIGEQFAAEHLTRLGFEVIERNFRTRFGELDLIAYGESQIVFCEVKTRVARATLRDPMESIDPRKRAQVRRIAGRWLAERHDHPRVDRLRFDAIGVVVDQAGNLLGLEHLEDAF